MTSLLIAILVGVLQGIFEWLPVSSEGNITLVLTALDYTPEAAVGMSLYLHLGTALSATAYYRDEIVALLKRAFRWQLGERWTPSAAEVTFLGIATPLSGAIGIVAYAVLLNLATAIAGGAFIAGIGSLLVMTGVLQRVANAVPFGDRTAPGPVDALLVGIGQGLAVLPGISRSGTTVSALLLRGHNGETSFRLSFLLSIPASVGGGILALLDGTVLLEPSIAVVALATSAVVGYLTIDGLLRVVRRIAFWAVCMGVGLLAVAGGVLVLVG